MRFLFSTAAAFTLAGLTVVSAQTENNESGEQDTSVGLPSEYADFLISGHSVSPDKKFAVIYPQIQVCTEDDDNGNMPKRCRDYLVALKPFRVLTALDTKYPEFQNKNHGGMSTAWSPDGSAVLVTLESKWGPGDIFLYELHDGKVTRSTDLLKKAEDLVRPSVKKAKGARYNDNFDFIFEVDDPEKPMCVFADPTHIRIHATATTDPKHIPGLKAWDGELEAVWDIAAAKFSSQKVTQTFAGTRKEDPDQ